KFGELDLATFARFDAARQEHYQFPQILRNSVIRVESLSASALRLHEDNFRLDFIFRMRIEGVENDFTGLPGDVEFVQQRSQSTSKCFGFPRLIHSEHASTSRRGLRDQRRHRWRTHAVNA